MEFKHKVTLQKDGKYSVGISIDQGFMKPDDLIKLGELAKKYHVNTVMATTAKKLNFMDVAEEYVNPLWDDLAELFGERLCIPKGKVVVCPGAQFCKSAVPGQDNHQIGREIIKISQAHNAGKVKVGVCACPTGCVTPRVRDIGVLGSGKGWTVTVGGNGGRKPGVGEVLATELSDEELLKVIDNIYTYLEENKQDKERTIRTIERLGLDHMKKAVL